MSVWASQLILWLIVLGSLGLGLVLNWIASTRYAEDTMPFLDEDACDHEDGFDRSSRCWYCGAPACETCQGEGVIWHQWHADPPGAAGLWRESERCPACRGGRVAL